MLYISIIYSFSSLSLCNLPIYNRLKIAYNKDNKGRY
nr:MAG TPA: hypothetical protein [Caudoviricetes sp.]